MYAKGSITRIAYVAESTPGTTPASPAMVDLPYVKFDAELVKEHYDDNSVFSDRMERYTIAGVGKVAGTISANLSYSNFAPLLETLCGAAFASDVLKTGTTLKTVTLEKWHPDITKGFVYTGCFLDKAQIKVPVNNIVTLDGTLAGYDMTTETSALDASTTAPTDEAPFTHLGGTIQEGGSTVAYFSSIDLSVDNTSVAQQVLSEDRPVGYTLGMSKISGQFTAYLPDVTLFTKYINGTPTSLQFTLEDPDGNALDFLLPNVTITGIKAPAQGQAPIVQTVTFKANRDATAASNIVITRTPAA
jgi:tail tube protein